MRPVQKVLTTLLWACAVLAMVSVIGANMWRGRAANSAAGPGVLIPIGTEEHLPVLGEAPAFSLIDQNEQRVTLENLRGRPFVTNFIFTNCAGPCPVMTAKMAQLQKELPANVKLVSVSVDPVQDRPAVLKDYGAKFNADHARWHFLTSPTTEPDEANAVYAVARGMYLTALPADEQNPIIHDERFVLVDAQGRIRGFYHSKHAEEMAQLSADAAELAAAGAPTTAPAPAAETN